MILVVTPHPLGALYCEEAKKKSLNINIEWPKTIKCEAYLKKNNCIASVAITNLKALTTLYNRIPLHV